MDTPKKTGLPMKLFLAFGAVCAFLGALTCFGMFVASISTSPKLAGQFLEDYVAYILGFAAIMYGNAAGGIIANHYSNK